MRKHTNKKGRKSGEKRKRGVQIKKEEKTWKRERKRKKGKRERAFKLRPPKSLSFPIFEQFGTRRQSEHKVKSSTTKP